MSLLRRCVLELFTEMAGYISWDLFPERRVVSCSMRESIRVSSMIFRDLTLRMGLFLMFCREFVIFFFLERLFRLARSFFLDFMFSGLRKSCSESSFKLNAHSHSYPSSQMIFFINPPLNNEYNIKLETYKPKTIDN